MPCARSPASVIWPISLPSGRIPSRLLNIGMSGGLEQYVRYLDRLQAAGPGDETLQRHNVGVGYGVERAANCARSSEAGSLGSRQIARCAVVNPGVA